MNNKIKTWITYIIFTLIMGGIIFAIGWRRGCQTMEEKKVIHWKSKTTGETGQGSIAIVNADEICRIMNKRYPEFNHWAEKE